MPAGWITSSQFGVFYFLAVWLSCGLKLPARSALELSLPSGRGELAGSGLRQRQAPLIDKPVDLAAQPQGFFRPKPWILPLEQTLTRSFPVLVFGLGKRQ